MKRCLRCRKYLVNRERFHSWCEKALDQDLARIQALKARVRAERGELPRLRLVKGSKEE